MAEAWFSLDGIEYRVSGPDRRWGPDGDEITIRRADREPIPGCVMKPGIVQLRDEKRMPKGLERAARAALAPEQRRYEEMSYKTYHYSARGSARAPKNARGNG